MASTPAAQALRQSVERGEPLSLDAVSPAAQPFLAVLLASLFPGRPIILVTESLKTQEVFLQDAQTWAAHSSALRPPAAALHGSSEGRPPLFYPAWEVLPHEARLPHVDVISERLETLVALSEKSAANAAIVVTSVTALLQKT